MSRIEERAVRSGAPWFARFQRYLARRERVRALALLEKVIEDDLPLFDLDHEIAADRRVAWLCRIDLLREMGHLTQALAWACLECELHPDNVAAQALKEELKRQTRMAGRPTEGGPTARTIVRWHGLAGMRELRAQLERDIILPLLDPARYQRYGLSLPNGVLLYGPPGCGKTFIASVLANVIGFKFFDITPSDLGSTYVHGGQLKIRALFDRAKQGAPAMIFFDEFEALVPSRSGGNVQHHYESEVNEFLTQLNECARARILVVAATNLPQKIDRAVLRPGRIDKQFYVGPPDLEARVELFRLYLAQRPVEGVDYLALGEASDNYTPVEIREIVNEGARAALEGDTSICQAHLTGALAARPPSLGPPDGGDAARRIGF